MKTLLQHKNVHVRDGDGQNPGTTEVHAVRCRFDGMQSDIVIVRAPSFYTEGPDAEKTLKAWMRSNYPKPCRAVGVLYLHNLGFSAGDANMKVSKHLGAFRRTCHRKLIPSVIRAVPTLSHVTSNEIIDTVTQFRRQANDEGVQFCSTLPDGNPFDGKPETAWGIVQDLLASCDNGSVGVPRDNPAGSVGKAEVKDIAENWVHQLAPPDHAQHHHTLLPDGWRSCLNLADSLYKEFLQQGLADDIDKAIRAAHKALEQCSSGHPGQPLSQECLARCRKAKVARARPKDAGIGSSSSDSSDIKNSIKEGFFETVANLPPRLLHTPTGVICNRDTQLSYFEGSAQYERLLSSASSLTRQQLQTEIGSAVTDFFQIAMLSHRWGSGEPSLRDVEGKNIYDLRGTDGLEKLQKFCILALECHFEWAWSDTCCINAESSAELQEAVGSMFSWYRRSALTIVYLSNVPDGGSFADCTWFERGWTLQELLASPAVLFYMNDPWSLYKNSDSANHKRDPAVLEELQNATGVAIQHLENFNPGVDDARTRLRWASGRKTTRPQDIAYSLFGIFNVHLPVIYSEPAEHALGRLLAEIITRSGDVSVLDWVGVQSSFNSCLPANLAPYRLMPQDRSTPNDPIRRNAPVLAKARELYSTLAALPRAGFVNSRLQLPSIIHKVTNISEQSFSTSSSHYTYMIHASRLRPANITLSHQLSNKASAYILVRPWDPKSLETQTESDDEAAWEQLERLRQPFNALLLEKLHHNEYKRIASDYMITAYVQDLASILDTEVLVLGIV
ncbi:hypothetical protein F5J12DRAFT_410509 [Pisolithus orientalis]|uniref:uncharacterized protein n=1 Tax=Pisolithus orientalis TaxID=936130 RepID=UPI002225666C|nr:uncharacterized protein F5J12DRAFT_410509 [Pisolithus orientalis]KAI5994945.1 hypothetical protein F5J12DRAFT_410509 [Pisolithus orientalis]